MGTKISFTTDEPKNLKYVVIASRYNGEWIFVRQKKRTTFEIPGGKIENGENHFSAAKRELYEETGATEFNLAPVAAYTVERADAKSAGFLYFAEVTALAGLPSGFEMEERIFSGTLPALLTYPDIQPVLFAYVQKFLSAEVHVFNR